MPTLVRQPYIRIPAFEFSERWEMIEDQPGAIESLTDVWNVTYHDHNAESHNAAFAPGVPAIGSMHPTYAGLYLLDKSARGVRVEQGKSFDVYCRYSSETEALRQGEGEDLSFQPPTMTYAYETFDEIADSFYDLDAGDAITPIQNTVGESLDPPAMQQSAVQVLTIRRYYPDGTTRIQIRDMLEYYEGGVNHATFDGRPKGCVKIDHNATEVFRKNRVYWLVTHVLRYKWGKFYSSNGGDGVWSGWATVRRNESFHYLTAATGGERKHWMTDDTPPRKVSRPQPIDIDGTKLADGEDPISLVLPLHRPVDFEPLGLFQVPTPVWIPPTP